MFQRILLAWDGSEVALRAFDVAIDITRRYEAELVAVSIAYSPAHAETDADRRETADAAHRYLDRDASPRSPTAPTGPASTSPTRSSTARRRAAARCSDTPTSTAST